MTKNVFNTEFELPLSAFIDSKQNVWFVGNDVTKFLAMKSQEMLCANMFMKNIKWEK